MHSAQIFYSIAICMAYMLYQNDCLVVTRPFSQQQFKYTSHQHVMQCTYVYSEIQQRQVSKWEDTCIVAGFLSCLLVDKPHIMMTLLSKSIQSYQLVQQWQTIIHN